MMTAAVLALCLAAPSSGPGPTAPAKPTPPAARSIHVSTAYGPLADPVEDCTRKALAAVAAEEGFRFAEVGKDGSVTGYTDAWRVAVVVKPGVDGAFFYVLAAGRGGDADRVADRIRNRVQAVKAGAKGTTAGTRDAEVEKGLPPLAWHVETRLVSDLCRYFLPVAGLTLEKRGYRPTAANPYQLSAVREGRGVALALMAGGVQGVSINFLVAGTGEDSDAVGKDVKALGTAILKALFE